MKALQVLQMQQHALLLARYSPGIPAAALKTLK